MRLHRLSVTAFGPFAGSEQVDFDQLSADGLFLLHGRTGAGKTSVLDAVCFALYGAVPGARSGGAPDLRSHHAAPQVAPVVELELTAGGRRLRVERTPAWTRPKRRGEGTTTEQARTLLAEWAPDAADAGADGWRPLSSRNDEASQVLTDVLGMGLAQFATVVLLPQGEFATFLRSGVTERRALLQRLFSTDRYERAERWLATERARTAAAHESAAARLAALADRAEQAGAEWAPAPGPPADHGPEHHDDHDDDDDAAAGGQDQGKTQAAATPDDTTVAAPAGPPQVLQRVRALAAATQQAALRTEGARVSAAAHARSAATAEHAHRDAVDRTRRAARVREEQRHLARTAPQVQHQREELAAATAAQAVEGHLRALAGAQEVLEGAERRAADAAAALTAAAGADPLAGTDVVTGAVTGAEVEVAGLRERAARHRQEQGRLAELVELEADTAQREQQARQVAAEHDRLAQAQTRLRAQLARGAERRTELTARAESAQEAAAGTQDAEQALARAQEVLQHATTADRLAARCEAARTAAASAAQHALDARSRWLDARQARWEGVAAELAAQLRSGQACPVCGACEHPAPAHLRTVPETTDDDAPAVPVDPAAAAAAEERAQGAFERAEADARAAQQHVSDLERAAAAARGACGGTTAAEAADLLQQARVRAEAARNALTSLQATRAELEQVRTAEAADTTALAQASDALARLVERAESLAQGLARDRARLEAAAGQEGLAARSARLAALAGAAEALAGAVEAETAARHAADVAADAARGAATAAGFVDLAAARAALRTAAHRDQLQRAVSAHERAVAAVHAQLAELARSAADDAREAPATTAEASSVDHVDQADKVDESDESDEADAVAAAEGALAEAARQRAAAEDAAEAAVRAAERAATAAAQLERLETEVARACAALEPLAREAELAGDLARCADGTGGGNTRRMKLSTYVLAARLEQVAAVASERLEVMSDGRYRLTHTDALERLGAGSGLGLRVVDAWTGVERDVATLSGGETFMASLALALGLADVVRSEGGGSPVETLFVDEGFGTLDPESLEEVMGVLEQLRAGGRAVGLVSHVPELRTRVPARLEVLRTATGSRLSTVLA